MSGGGAKSKPVNISNFTNNNTPTVSLPLTITKTVWGVHVAPSPHFLIYPND
jgi:hypothetical protein